MSLRGVYTMQDNAEAANAKQETEKNGSSVEHDYESVLELIGFGKVQWYVLLTAGLLLMMVICETMGMSILTIASQCDFDMNSVDKAVMSAACFLGLTCSSYFLGYYSDTLGRRKVLIYTTFAGNVASVISMFIPEYWTFVFMRFVVGIFIAGASSTIYAYLGEFCVARHRPVVNNYSSMFAGIAMAYVPCVAWGVLSMKWSLEITSDFHFRPWRLLIVLNALPGFIATLVLLKLPESPKFLLSLRREAETLAAVNWICYANTGRTLADLKVYKLRAELMLPADENTQIGTDMNILKKMWQDTSPLFKRPHVLNFLISCVVMCGLFFSSAGMSLWYPEIQNRVGANSGSLTVCQVIDASIEQQNQNANGTALCNDTINDKSYIDSITFGVSFVAGYVVLGMVVNALGRKLVMIGTLCVSVLCGIAFYWILNPIAIVVCFCIFLLMPGLCISILSGAVVDLVPTHLRGKAVCIVMMLGRGGSILGSNLLGILLESNCTLTFGVFTGIVFFCTVLTLILPI